MLASLIWMVWVALTRDFPFVNLDVAHNLIGGRRMAAGGILYRDWIDNNPPLIYEFSRLITTLTSKPALQTLIYHVVVWTIAVFFLFVTRFDRGSEEEPSKAVKTLILLLCFFSNTIAASSFGQRDHVLALILVGHSLSDIPRRWPRWALAWSTTLGICLSMKPHFLILLAGIEGLRWIETKQTRLRDFSIVVAAMTIPILAFAGWNQTAWSDLLTHVLQPQITGVFLAYGLTLEVAWQSYTLGACLAYSGFSLTILSICWFHGRETLRAIACLLVLCLGGLVVLLQGKCWDYHFHVMACVSSVVLASVDRLVNRTCNRRLEGLLLVVLSVFVLRGILDTTITFAYDNPLVPQRVARQVAGHTRIFVVSPSVAGDFSFFYQEGVANLRRLSYDLYFPAAFHLPPGEKRSAELKSYADDVNREIRMFKPSLILFSPDNQALWPFHQHTFPVIYNELRERLDLADYEFGLTREDHGVWVVLTRRRS